MTLKFRFRKAPPERSYDTWRLEVIDHDIFIDTIRVPPGDIIELSLTAEPRDEYLQRKVTEQILDVLFTSGEESLLRYVGEPSYKEQILGKAKELAAELIAGVVDEAA